MLIEAAYLKKNIRSVPDWPKPGVMFRDVTTLFEKPDIMRDVIDSLIHRYRDMEFSRIGALDARGFLLGSTLAYALNKPLVLFRKKGKLPAKTIACDYDLEYGTATLEVHADSIVKNDKVLLIDDLIASGGTLLAAANLIQRLGGSLVEAGCIMDLSDLGGSKKLHDAGITTFSLCEFKGE